MFQIKVEEKVILWPSIYILFNSFINPYLNLKLKVKVWFNWF